MMDQLRKMKNIFNLSLLRGKDKMTQSDCKLTPQ